MGSSSAGFVAVLTAAAVATVGFLGFRASATVPADLAKPLGGESAAATSKAPRDGEHPKALPVASGLGERVVYSVDDDRVWLVAQGDKVTRTFKVTPSTVDPLPGTYTVTSRSNTATGSDGTLIEHVVRFTSVDGVAIGFSAAVDGSTPTPDPTVQTGGIRESRADGDAMWQFATIGHTVVVIR
ncbi:hypothetical protein [Streptomyces sp. GESEQ-35]|uniref:hypothetical protein n=1 Tax=Streptomyces sp. GESEQ-35 TaxID=2812657 RepID=UPI001B32FADD|nr:hypothetical protein [Streptomyces sp. GESEQ-35]